MNCCEVEEILTVHASSSHEATAQRTKEERMAIMLIMTDKSSEIHSI